MGVRLPFEMGLRAGKSHRFGNGGGMRIGRRHEAGFCGALIESVEMAGGGARKLFLPMLGGRTKERVHWTAMTWRGTVETARLRSLDDKGFKLQAITQRQANPLTYT